jgi:hypothetical protein
MKRLTTILMLLVTLNLSASHLTGGMITVTQTNQDSTSVSVYLVSDPQGISSNIIYVERWEMNSPGIYTQNGTMQAIKDTTISHQGMNIHTYVSNYLNLDSTKKYRFIYKNCCWGILNNSPNSFSSDFIISADYWHIPNNSLPYIENPLWINVQNNTLNTMKPIWGISNCFLSQFDNDSVNITQSDLYSGYSNGTFVSQFHTPLNLSVSNDSISWTPTALGKYGTGFEITEYRNGQLIGAQRIQWSFRVINPIVGIDEYNIEHYVRYKIYNWSGEYLGNKLENQNGFLIIRYSSGKVRKIFKM